MKHPLLLVSLASLLAIANAKAADSPFLASFDNRPSASSDDGSFYDVWIRGRFAIGLSAVYSKLTDNKREPDRESGKTFVGYLNLMEDQDKLQFLPEITYRVSDFIRLNLAFEKIRARVYNYDMTNPRGHHSSTDGLAKIGGPVLMAELFYPMCGNSLFPHVGIGAFFGFASLHEDSWWHRGYSTPEEFRACGSPMRTKSGYHREIHVDDGVGFAASAGLCWLPIDHFQLDLAVRQTWIDNDCEFGYTYPSRWDKHRDGEFCFDNLAVSLTASYLF